MPTVARSPDGKRIVSVNWYGSTPNGDFAIRLWEVDTGKEVRRFIGLKTLVLVAVFLPDGSRGLSCSHDSTVRLWDSKTGNELQQFTGHEDA